VLLEITLLADEQHAETLADALLDTGALSVAVEDADAQSDNESPLFGEPGLEPERQAWLRSRLRVLVDAGLPHAERLIEAAGLAMGLRRIPIESVKPVAEADWVRVSQAQFPPTRISERLWIVPSWHAAPDPAAVVVQLDPGVAFGTGTHPTTQLCLAWLDQNISAGSSVLDYGCGSGILAIAAGKLGARQVVGVDVDEQALVAARINSRANRVSARYTEPSGLASGAFDIVLANILSNPLKLLAPALLARVAPGGALVLSGLLERQADDVIATYRAFDERIELKVWRVSEGWACLAGQRSL
jgi:ribosomal protein L11 methyltransferase